MGTNTAAPNGLNFSRNLNSNSPTFQANVYAIKRGYATNLYKGDLVKTLTGANQGYVGLSLLADISHLGVFVGITSPPSTLGVGGASGGGVYDLNLQAMNYGLNGAYVSTILPPTGIDVGALVIDDPGAVFIAQMVGGSWTTSLRGQNINFTAASNGNGNISGTSALSLDFASIGVGNQLPFRIIGLSGVGGGPQDPGNVNPWIEVVLNTPETRNSTGI